MRPFHDVLVMWNQYDDRELADWQWEYERKIRGNSASEHAEYMLQDLTAIRQIMKRRGL